MKKGGLSTLVIIALALALLAVTNPKQEDFRAYLSGQASSQVGGKDQGGVIGALSKGAAALAGGVSSLAGGAYTRKDYLVCSTFGLGDSGPLYLGLARKLFIKIR